MGYRCKITVLDKKLYPQLHTTYCANPESGKCPVYNPGDEFIFYRNAKLDNFWHMGAGMLVKCGKSGISSAQSSVMHCGEPGVPFYSGAWDASSRYIYAGLQGGSIMRGRMKDRKVMIACCNNGTRSVIFKIERLDIDEK